MKIPISKPDVIFSASILGEDEQAGKPLPKKRGEVKLVLNAT
jgi:hypothetical protein